MSKLGKTNRSATRRGYALLIVLLFNVLFLMLLGVTYRQMASALRVASATKEQTLRDEGVVSALGRGLRMLETGRPPIGAASEYQCYTTIGSKFYLLTFRPYTEQGEKWSVTASVQSQAPVGIPYKTDSF